MAYLPGFDICAGDPPAEDACYGDSGGPLLVREGDAWAQVGVVSRGEGCAAYPGLYADATALREWILTTADFEPPETPRPSHEPSYMPTYRPSVAFEGQDRAAPQPSARRTAPPTPRPVALDSAPQPTTRPPTRDSSPTPRPVALDSAPQQESSPTSRPTEPSATPDDPLGLPEDSATAAPAAESDAALGRRLAWAAAACALAALLL